MKGFVKIRFFLTREFKKIFKESFERNNHMGINSRAEDEFSSKYGQKPKTF